MSSDLDFTIFVDNANAERQCGLRTIHKKQDFPHECEPDVEDQNMHIVLPKSPRDITQVNTLSAKLSIGSELVE